MLTPDAILPFVADGLARLVLHLGEPAETLAADLEGRIERFGRIKGERGRAAVAASLGLQDAELAEVDRVLRDLQRTLARRDGSSPSERNAVIAGVRLLAWFETIGQRIPELAPADDVEALVSEELGRKQVRALELIVRSLITESYADQEKLVARLKDALSDKVVARWKAAADQGDILSGCSFSELASLFVNKEEFDRYEPLYEDTPFLTLQKQRRRTIQAFLDDVRRLRNRLAHNKKITNTQLTLLDLYYEEIVGPVQTAFDEGETRVDPAAFLEVDPADLDGYFHRLQDDVLQVQDDLAGLRSAMEGKLGALAADTAELKETTRGIDRKVVWVGVGVVVLIAGAIFLATQGGKTQEGVEAARASTERTEAVTQRTADDVEAVREATRETADATSRIAEGVEDTADAARAAAEEAAAAGRATEEAGEKIEDAAEDVSRSATAMEEAAETTQDAAAKTRAAADEVKETAGEMKEATERVAQTLAELRDGFAALVKQGGIIPNATRPQEHYHNARVFEQRGDVAQAMQSYREYFTYADLEFVDPHLRYQSFLKLQNGAAGAREVYYDMKRGSDAPVLDLAWALLLDGEARLGALEAFVDAHPEFAPAWYALSRDFSVARLGTQSLEDKRREKETLERFVALQEEGSFLRYYLAQAVAVDQLEDARERLAALGQVSEEVLQNPVTLSAMKSSIGWTVSLSISDTVKEIFYRIGTEGEFQSTGFSSGMRTREGLPMAKPAITLPANAPQAVIQVKYKDARDREHGPYDLEFDPLVQEIQGTKSILAMTRNSWVSFRDFNEKLLVYFSHLVSYRGALREIRYGRDRDTPDESFPLGPADPQNPHAPGTVDMPFLELPEDTRYLVVQLVYKDGTESEVVRFDR